MGIEETVTEDNFVRAETANYFGKQAAHTPVNTYSHHRVPVDVETQVIIRSNVDMIFSIAVVDVTEEAEFHLAPSEEYQVAQIIDENHYIVGVVYPGETFTLRNSDLSTGNHVYVLGRTSTAGGLDRAHALQDARRITAATDNPYVPAAYDSVSLDAVRASLEARSAEVDFGKAFGTPGSTVPEQHLLGTALGWGGLSPQHAQYFQGLITSSGCDAWTFDLPPLDYEHNGYFSVIKYDRNGWLDVARPGLTDRELERDDDGRITVWFGDRRCAGRPNTIEATEGQRFYFGIRLYRPRDVDEIHRYIDRLRSSPAHPVTP
ncbi:hypothetical protein [Streptomyces sp. bgisy091]|uniref:hypothetical protein n=1 Tax=Streptomyces sp. bgisy091 TaxID=3413778 RepID=UPI003D754E5A